MQDSVLDILKQEKLRRAQGNQENPQPDALSLLMQEKERRQAEKENSSWYDPAVEMAVKAADTVDSYTHAPLRKAIGSLQEGNDLGQALNDGAGQFGENTNLAPTSKKIMEDFGVSASDSLADISPKLPEFLNPTSAVDSQLRAQGFNVPGSEQKLINRGDPLDISKAGAAGFALDMVDPLAAIPLAKIASSTIKGGKALNAAQKGFRAARRAEKVIEGAQVVNKADSIVKQSAKSLKTSLDKIFNPKIADDYKDFKLIAEKNGLDPELLPEAVKYGEDSFISRKGRGVAEGPLGAERLLKHNKAVDDISEAVVKKIDKYTNGQTYDLAGAGSELRDGYAKGLKNLYDQIDIKYKDIEKLAPGIGLSDNAFKNLNSKLNGVEKFAKGRLLRGVTATQKSQAKELINSVKALRNNNGTIKQVYEAMRDIGEAAYPKKAIQGTIPSDIKKLREIYKSASEAVVDTVREQLGDEMADGLLQNNKLMSNFFKEQAPVEALLKKSDLADETLFKNLVMNGNTHKIKALKKSLPPSEFNKVKGHYLRNIIKTNIDGDILFKSTYNALTNKNNLSRLNAIFEPSEIKEIVEVLKLGDRIGEKVLSRSGTGASNVFKDIGETVRGAIENEAVIEAAKRRAVKLSSPKPPKPPKVKTIDTTSRLLKSLKKNERKGKGALISSRIIEGNLAETGGRSIGNDNQTKWQNEGREKLTGLISLDSLEELEESKKGREFLMQGSAVSKDSKAMKSLIKKINKYLKKEK